MSNLSELLPAGGAAKEFEPVASGTLPNGQAVILNANGTVEAVAESSSPGAQIPAGAATACNTNSLTYIDIAMNPSVAGQFVVAYRDSGNSNYFTANLGQVTGTSITFGSNVIIYAGNCVYMQIAFDPNTANRFVVGCHNEDQNNRGTAFVGTISGSTLSFSAEMFWGGGNPGIFLGIAYDPNQANRFVAMYYNGSNSNYGTVVVGTVSSATNINYSSVTVFESSYSASVQGISFDPNTSGKFVIAWRDQSTSPSYGGSAIIGTLSGTSFSFGTKNTFALGGTTNNIIVNYDPNTANSFLVTYKDATTQDGTAIVGTVSGTTITYGSPVTINTTASQVMQEFDPSTANQFVVMYDTKVRVGTISGNAITFGDEYTLPNADSVSSNRGGLALGFDEASADGRFVTINQTGTNFSAGRGGFVALSDLSGTVVTTNVADFVGITAEAIADTATGKVNAKGGVASSVANIAPLINFSTATEFNNGNTEFIEIAFDPNNTNKCVICYRDAAQSGYGKAIVGTVSGTSISFGTMEAHFNAGSTNRPSLAWDPDNSGKLVIAYCDLGNTSQGTAVVGTVSGTSISFGSEVIFCTGETQQTAITFNSSNTYVITYRNEGNSNYGEGIVGTVSGTSISFGTASVFNSASTATNQVAADPNTANTVVVAYSNAATNPSTGGAAVGTVSGTSISWGSEQQFASTETDWVRMAFDPNNAGKFVIMWRDGAGSDGATIVGNVSGTSITYGAKTLFLAGANQSADNIAFDTNKANSIILSYNKSGGKVVEGTITGNSIAYGTTYSYANTTGHNWIAIDPSAAGKFALAYQDGSDSGKGKVIMGQSSEALTTGSDYYLQSDGSVSTATASPAINIGRAISPTSLILR